MRKSLLKVVLALVSVCASTVAYAQSFSGNVYDSQGPLPDGSVFNPVQRDCVPALGRPWKRMAPVQEVFTETFADKEFDSRFDGTFTYKFHANWQKSGSGPATAIGPNGKVIKPGNVSASDTTGSA